MDFRKAVFCTALILALAGCGGLPDEPPGALSTPKPERLSDQLFMIPFARDDRGCVLYQVRTPRPTRDRTIYWRIGPGHFSDDPSAARCV